MKSGWDHPGSCPSTCVHPDSWPPTGFVGLFYLSASLLTDQSRAKHSWLINRRLETGFQGRKPACSLLIEAIWAIMYVNRFVKLLRSVITSIVSLEVYTRNVHLIHSMFLFNIAFKYNKMKRQENYQLTIGHTGVSHIEGYFHLYHS